MQCRAACPGVFKSALIHNRQVGGPEATAGGFPRKSKEKIFTVATDIVSIFIITLIFSIKAPGNLGHCKPR